MKSLKLEDFSDRELLLIIHDVRDAEGWSTAKDVAERIDIEHPRPWVPVASRLGWLRRFGATEREFMWDEFGNPMYTAKGEIRYTQRWRLTEAGLAVAHGNINSRQQEQLERFKDDQLLLVTRWLAERQRNGDGVAAALVRREWKHGLAQ
jgi:hypothetical protein